MNPLLQVLSHRDHETYFFVGARSEHHHAGTEARTQYIGHLSELLGRCGRNFAREDFDTRNLTSLLLASLLPRHHAHSQGTELLVQTLGFSSKCPSLFHQTIFGRPQDRRQLR